MKKQNKISLLLVLTLISFILLLFINPVAQSTGFHHFADDRRLFHLANFMNVVSNLLFLVVGISGLRYTWQTVLPGDLRFLYSTLFAGILLTGIGSGYYHLHPGNATLVFDRIPMTIVFMSFLCLTIVELISRKAGIILLAPLVLMGICSVLYWHYTETAGHGDLRWYGWVQFYPMIAIPLIIYLFPSPSSAKTLQILGWVIAWYVLAKILERFDQQIFLYTSLVSGHTLKHLAAGMATWYIYRYVRRKEVPLKAGISANPNNVV